MQLPLSFWTTPPPDTTPAWDTLDDDHRALVVTRLAAVIAKLASARRAPRATKEARDG